MTVRRPLSPREVPPQDSDRKGGEELQSATLEMLLRWHGATRTYVIVLDAFGRLASTLLIVYFGLVKEFAVTQLVSSLLVAILVTTLWSWRRRRLLEGAVSVEETLSRMAGGVAERAYIESRFISEARRGSSAALRAEPAIWLAASLVVLALSVIVNGVTS